MNGPVENADPPPADPKPKLAPEDIELRAKPRPVTRINRRMLGLAVGGTGILLAGIAIVALDPPNFRDEGERRELFRTENNPMPDEMEALPKRYTDFPPKIELGPPLPGDLGPSIVEKERDLGIGPPATPFRPSPEDDAARAERIRQARLAQQGREAAVFFSLSNRQASALTSTPDIGAFANASPPGDALAPSGAAGPLELDRESDPALQGRKLDFASRTGDGNIYNPHRLESPASPYQVMAGTIIAASLITGLNSDLPGRVIAQVTENVFDTPTGRHLLIPQGTRVLGRYDSVVAFGQSRALVVWERLILPDGTSIVIDNWPATDTAGYAGLEDEVDNHTFRLLKGIGLSTLLGVGTELTFGNDENDLVEAIRESTQDSANQVGQRIVQRNLDIQPTLTVRPGWPLRIIANKDLILRPYDVGAIR
ncbi:TrbI/VirB10 family protein [uncultured Erythrobacter sp.]|uniref:TrbI/VirB10 family protein n=1 Tax=uncultured Erythrobacter sp. TaxID=263913 RepID=UPI002608417F|nr:TrbI/VirB10 family protein [uncultured Erythrobacter sp.]